MTQDLIALSDRAILEIAEPDARGLLQGVLTQDMAKSAPGSLLYGALLTPQGKMIADLFIACPAEDVFWLDVPALARADLKRRFTLYRLRAKATISDRDEIVAAALEDAPPNAPGIFVARDPRLPALGWRIYAAPGRIEADPNADRYDAARLALGVPDPIRDLAMEQDFLLEGLFDELNGVDFKKGCYVGQEMTSRMKRRGTVRTKLTPIVFEGDAPPPDTAILAGDWEVGRVRSGRRGRAMALVRFDRAAKADAPLTAAGKPVALDPPDWLIRPAAAE
jgi:tRNA-modifying protein YgfZ